jgi:hypothetical protein
MILDKASDQLLQNTEGIDWSRVAEQVCLRIICSGIMADGCRSQDQEGRTRPQNA